MTEPAAADPDPEALASGNLEWALGLARSTCKGMLWFHDEAESAALLGLAQAVRSFDPGRGVSFRAHARARVAGAVLDEMRLASPKGYGRRGAGGPAVIQQSQAEAHEDAALAAVPAGDGPVGWEAEYADLVRSLAGELDRPARAAFLASYLDCGSLLRREAAAKLGVTAKQAGELLAQAGEAIRRSPRFRPLAEGRPGKPAPRRLWHRGVIPDGRRYRAFIRHAGRLIYLGLHDSAELAAAAYAAAADRLRGPAARDGGAADVA